jgi:adenine deaminase
MAKRIKGRIVDIFNKKIFDGEVVFENGVIVAINPAEVLSSWNTDYIFFYL